MLITVLVVTALVYLLGRPPGQAAFFGFLFALSSTAIVLKTYMDRLEIDSPHGKAGVGILLFQDLCIVPMMLLVPVLSGREGSSISNIAIRLGTAVGVITGIISIGMLLSLGSFAADLPTVLVWFGALVLGKLMIVLAVMRLMGNSLRVAVMVGIGLAQVGEFSFILAKVGLAQGLLSPSDYQRFLAASVLSMIVTPFLIKAAQPIGYALQAWLLSGSLLAIQGGDSAAAGHDLSEHVVVVGYGINGRNLTKVLHRVGIPYVVLELNAEVVRGARAQGVPIEYGDASRKEVLHHVGLQRAGIMVVAISDSVSTRRTVAIAREINPEVRIIVRTRYMAEVEELYQLGANQVIPEEFETSIEIFSRVLREYGVSRNIIEHEVEEVRSEGYQMLRSASLPLAELSKIAEAFGSTATETVFISPNSPAIGKTLKELDLRNQTGASVTAAIRDGDTQINLGPEFRIVQDDILVLLGQTEQLEKAVEHINQGKVIGRQATGRLHDPAMGRLTVNHPDGSES